MHNQAVLTVCAANVCRSPAMAFLLEDALLGESAGQVTYSAGATARAGASICRKTAGLVEGPGWTDFARQHRSTILGTADIASAGLILTASTAERGAVARLAPSARTRTFTLVEAAALAESAVHAGVRVPWSADLVAIAAALNAQRGSLAPPPRLPWWRRHRDVDPFDIPDAHTTSEKHIAVIADVVDAAQRLRAARASLA